MAIAIAMCLWLLDIDSYISGHTLLVDGGGDYARARSAPRAVREAAEAASRPTP